MIPGYKLRVAAAVMGFIMMIYASATLVSDMLSSGRPAFPADPTHMTALPIGPFEDWAAITSPLRGPIEANYAMLLGLKALRSGGEKPAAEQNNLTKSAQTAARKALSLSPYDAQIWLLAAMLESRINQRSSKIADSLMMSYFTAPNDAALMPVRLDTATLFGAVANPDLAELARGDVRMILTRRPDLRVAISNAYRRASAEGKAFLEQAVGAIDPQFLPVLRGGKPS
jgi:hypothetical protein